ncbi:MAG TPA: serine/threonine-protein kinase [Planctomycetota bacterium]
MNCPRCDAPAKTETLRELGGVCEKCLLDFAAEKDAPAFPNLKILRTLGEGGMGVVYEAEQTALGRKVALKVLSPALASDPSFVERFTREAKALAQLTHPNIVGIHEFGVHDGVPYLVMEYVDGVSLRNILKKLDSVRALEIVPQICDALAYAHSRGVVHRDIKPENILLDRQGRVKIADFGLAKLAEPDQTRITRTNVVMGTPHYMAPEQMESPNTVDHRADLFSLGVVFYEMLTGELPLGRFKAPSERADVDRRLDPVVLKSLERAPADRWQSADAMKERVTRLEAVPPPAQGPRNVYAIAALACLGLAALLGATVGGRADATWAAVFKTAAPLLTAAFVLSVGAILKAPKVDGRRVGIAPALFALAVLGLGLVVALIAIRSEPSHPVQIPTAAIVLGLVLGGGGWFFSKRRTFIQTAWFLLAAALGLAILAMEWTSNGLAMATAGAVLGANVLAFMGLVSLRGRAAPGQKVAGWAVPVVTLFLASGLVSSSAPAKPAASGAGLSYERVEEFGIDDLWPEDLPSGLRFGTVAELRQAMDEAALSLSGVDSPKTAVVLPGPVILVGIESKERPGPLSRWNERRLACARAQIHLINPNTGTANQSADVLRKRLHASLPGAAFRRRVTEWKGKVVFGYGLDWPPDDVHVKGVSLGRTINGPDALKKSGFPQEMMDGLKEVRYRSAPDRKVEMVGFVFTDEGYKRWARYATKPGLAIGQTMTIQITRAETPELLEAVVDALR